MRAVPLLVLAALAGCAVGPSRAEILASLVGHPESDALRVLGAPNRTYDANGSKFLAYDDARLDYAPAPGFGPWAPFGYGYYVIPPTVAYQRVCVMTVEVTGGVVRSWNLRGNTC